MINEISIPHKGCRRPIDLHKSKLETSSIFVAHILAQYLTILEPIWWTRTWAHFHVLIAQPWAS
ncbi:hypothetical protein Hanom_Chr08g00725521 [Helianthus anomalus]